jgi:hypothetical protein
VGFNIKNPQGKVEPYRVCRKFLEVVYMGFNGDMHVYAGLHKEMCVHLEKHARFGLYNRAKNC